LEEQNERLRLQNLRCTTQLQMLKSMSEQTRRAKQQHNKHHALMSHSITGALPVCRELDNRTSDDSGLTSDEHPDRLCQLPADAMSRSIAGESTPKTLRKKAPRQNSADCGGTVGGATSPAPSSDGSPIWEQPRPVPTPRKPRNTLLERDSLNSFVDEYEFFDCEEETFDEPSETTKNILLGHHQAVLVFGFSSSPAPPSASFEALDRKSRLLVPALGESPQIAEASLCGHRNGTLTFYRTQKNMARDEEPLLRIPVSELKSVTRIPGNPYALQLRDGHTTATVSDGQREGHRGVGLADRPGDQGHNPSRAGLPHVPESRPQFPALCNGSTRTLEAPSRRPRRPEAALFQESGGHVAAVDFLLQVCPDPLYIVFRSAEEKERWMVVEFDGSTEVGQCLSSLCLKLGMRPALLSGYALYIDHPTNGGLQLLKGKQKLCDCLTLWERRERDVKRGRVAVEVARLELRLRHYWPHLAHTETMIERGFLAWRSAEEIVEGRVPLGPQLAEDIMALYGQLYFGDLDGSTSQQQFDYVTSRFYPRKMLDVANMRTLRASLDQNWRQMTGSSEAECIRLILQDPIRSIPFDSLVAFGAFHSDFMLTVERVLPPDCHPEETPKERLTFSMELCQIEQ
ncbi:unnamed protein product, partial [Mesorhabditis spiculigera]